METCVLFQDLRETIDKQSEQIRKLKKMLKIYAKKLKDGEGEQNDAFSFFFFFVCFRPDWDGASLMPLLLLLHIQVLSRQEIIVLYIYIKNKECEERKLL